jgi:hypothetical protein
MHRQDPTPLFLEANMTPEEAKAKSVLNSRLEDFGWGALLITIGTIGLVPEKYVPHGGWLIAAGIIILALNVFRYLSRIRMSGFGIVVGILALLAGLDEHYRLDLPLLSIALIVIGACILLKPVVEKDTFSPQDDGWCCCAPHFGETGEDRAEKQTVHR